MGRGNSPAASGSPSDWEISYLSSGSRSGISFSSEMMPVPAAHHRGESVHGGPFEQPGLDLQNLAAQRRIGLDQVLDLVTAV
jgi:hypothetical protein